MLTIARALAVTVVLLVIAVAYLASTLVSLNDALYECDNDGTVARSCVIDQMK